MRRSKDEVGGVEGGAMGGGGSDGGRLVERLHLIPAAAPRATQEFG